LDESDEGVDVGGVAISQKGGVDGGEVLVGVVGAVEVRFGEVFTDGSKHLVPV